ncbi:MAG: HAD family hydrolase [Promethearchaeota archaeon]
MENGIYHRQKTFKTTKISLQSLQTQLLSNYLQIKKTISSCEKSLLILDLDGTLIDNHHRQYKIYQNHIETIIPSLKRENIRKKWLNPLRPYSILSLLSPLISNKEKFKEIQQIFLREFLSPKYLVYDKIYPGVDDFIRWADFHSFHLQFLTGRYKDTMEKMTKDFLLTHIPQLTQISFDLILKKHFAQTDLIFKQFFFQELASNSRDHVVGLIDNEADICNLAKNYFPSSLIIQFVSQQSNQNFFPGLKLSSWKF